jgi:hypothetical protein
VQDVPWTILDRHQGSRVALSGTSSKSDSRVVAQWYFHCYDACALPFFPSKIAATFPPSRRSTTGLAAVSDVSVVQAICDVVDGHVVAGLAPSGLGCCLARSPTLPPGRVPLTGVAPGRPSSPSPGCLTSRSPGGASSSISSVTTWPVTTWPSAARPGRADLRPRGHPQWRAGPCPGRFRSCVITDGIVRTLHIDYKHSKIKQHQREGKALRARPRSTKLAC